MEPPSPRAVSRVTAEVTDLATLFPTFEPLLSKRLPLRNLHWKSPTRPLRSIDTLYVSLIQAEDGPSAGSSRRHQIPGLRQTPYLKIYLLRCDDTETYKTTAKKQIREWIKKNTPSAENKSSLNNQEDYDAFEWLIVHVVLPDTPAANQPRTSKNSSLGPTESTDSLDSKSKWSGKKSSTVYERLKNDFNTSKSAIDRVAQIRIAKNGPSQQAATSVLGPSEIENQWLDLVDKFKVAILASFDVRVSQYEEDIREKDNQRSLPGWNFCTFFILKEGLARAFEDVGLLEDALVGYDELAVGLDIIVREQAAGDDDDHGGTFLDFSEDLKSKARAGFHDLDVPEDKISTSDDSESMTEDIPHLSRESFPLDASNKPYRELILANNISVFDFRAYIFSRQFDLLLRGAHASTGPPPITEGKAKLAPSSRQGENFLLLAEACKRATVFITQGARTLRHELEVALEGPGGQVSKPWKSTESVINNIVSSWTYSAAIQVLMQTASNALVIPDTTSARSLNGPDAPSLPLTSTSKEPGVSNSRHSLRPMSQEFLASETNLTSRPPSEPMVRIDSRQPERQITRKTGTEELASWRAELFLLARKVLEEIGKGRGWLPSMSSLGKLYAIELVDENTLDQVSLVDTIGTESTNGSNEKQEPVSAGLQPAVLRDAAESEKAFGVMYEMLTDQVLRHFLGSNKMKLAESSITDLAIMNYWSRDYESAAKYFDRAASFYGAASWKRLQGLMLELYADSLKHLNRPDDYVRSLLRLLAAYASDRHQIHNTPLPLSVLEPYTSDLWSISEECTSIVTAPLTDFFDVVKLDPAIRHFEEKDGFLLTMSVSFRLGESLDLPSGIKVVLASSNDPQLPDLMLKTSGPISLKHSPTTVTLESHASILGWYEVNKIEMAVGKVTFVQERHPTFGLQPKFTLNDNDSASAEPNPRVSVLVYPTTQALAVKALPSPYINLSQPRAMLLELDSGWNDITSCAVQMRAATAGLRLHVQDMILIEADGLEDIVIGGHDVGSGVTFSHFQRGSTCRISVPYTLESPDIAEFSAKVEVRYTTERGEFVFVGAMVVNTILPINVNVQDMFKLESLFSRFTISPATLVPLRLEKCEIQSSEHFIVESGFEGHGIMDVFPKQPASILFRFLRRGVKVFKESPPLSLVVEFFCMDEVFLSAIEGQFNSDISESGFGNLARLLCNHLVKLLRSQWTEQDLEVACLCQEIEMWSYEDIGWESVLRGFGGEEQGAVRSWLQAWHGRALVIPLSKSVAPIRQITIPVVVPTPKFVLSVSLETEVTLDSTEPVTVGQPVAAKLQISYTRAWRGEDEGDDMEAIEFSYEIIASPETWLIGGQRRANFNPGNAQTLHLVPVILIPQRAGHLLRPLVEVKCFVAENSATKVLSGNRTEVGCEVEYKSQAKAMLVVPNLKETTIALDGESGGSWLVGSGV